MATNLIDLALKNKGLLQKDLAKQLGVSTTQISKWKKGDSIPYYRKDQIADIAGLFNSDIEWVEITRTKENAQKWVTHFQYLNDVCEIPNWRISDEPEHGVPLYFRIFKEFGINIPEKAPDAYEVDWEDEDDFYEYSDFDSFVIDYLENYGRIDNWFRINIESIGDFGTTETTHKIEDQLFDLALCWVEDNYLENCMDNTSHMDNFRRTTRRNVKKKIANFCKATTKLGFDIQENYFHLVTKSPEELEDDGIFKGVSEEIDEFFPLSHRLIFRHLKDTQEMVQELHVKVDTLLSALHRSQLSEYLALTKPSDNKYLCSIENKDEK